jgi:hypothetical protein
MAFAIAALALGGFTLYNLGMATDSGWALDPQERLARVTGNKGVNINYKQIATYWKPLLDPRKFTATETLAKRVRARLGSLSTDPIVARTSKRDLIKFNYRLGSGYSAGPNRQLEARWA